jgi:E3 ubiquitin-protein ligase Topors
MKSIDIRAESAVKLLSEFLDLDTDYIEGQRHPNAEHFAHGQWYHFTHMSLCSISLIDLLLEIYCYIRSGRDLSIYDNLVQV